MKEPMGRHQRHGKYGARSTPIEEVVYTVTVEGSQVRVRRNGRPWGPKLDAIGFVEQLQDYSEHYVG